MIDGYAAVLSHRPRIVHATRAPFRSVNVRPRDKARGSYRPSCSRFEPATEDALARTKDTEEWRQTVDYIKAIGIPEPDNSIAQAFGWSSQKYWRNEKHNQTPDKVQVIGNVEYLRSVGFGDGELRELIGAFPEVLGLNCEECLRPNVEYLQKSFFLKGTHRVKAILRKPRVIGNVIDCEGDCMGQCTRCWSQF